MVRPDQVGDYVQQLSSVLSDFGTAVDHTIFSGKLPAKMKEVWNTTLDGWNDVTAATPSPADVEKWFHHIYTTFEMLSPTVGAPVPPRSWASAGLVPVSRSGLAPSEVPDYAEKLTHVVNQFDKSLTYTAKHRDVPEDALAEWAAVRDAWNDSPNDDLTVDTLTEHLSDVYRVMQDVSNITELPVVPWSSAGASWRGSPSAALPHDPTWDSARTVEEKSVTGLIQPVPVLQPVAFAGADWRGSQSAAFPHDPTWDSARTVEEKSVTGAKKAIKPKTKPPPWAGADHRFDHYFIDIENKSKLPGALFKAISWEESRFGKQGTKNDIHPPTTDDNPVTQTTGWGQITPGALTTFTNNMKAGDERKKWKPADMGDPAKNLEVQAWLINSIAKEYKKYTKLDANWDDPNYVGLVALGYGIGASPSLGVAAIVSALEDAGVPSDQITLDAVIQKAGEMFPDSTIYVDHTKATRVPPGTPYKGKVLSKKLPKYVGPYASDPVIHTNTANKVADYFQFRKEGLGTQTTPATEPMGPPAPHEFLIRPEIAATDDPMGPPEPPGLRPVATPPQAAVPVVRTTMNPENIVAVVPVHVVKDSSDDSNWTKIGTVAGVVGVLMAIFAGAEMSKSRTPARAAA